MGNEKWILYNNVEHKRLWGKENEPLPIISKSGFHTKKVMGIWCDWKWVPYYELLLENQVFIPASIIPNQTNWKQKLMKIIWN